MEDKVIRREEELQFIQQLQAEKDFHVQRINAINEMLKNFAQLDKRERYERIEDRTIADAIVTSKSVYEVVVKCQMTMAKKSYDRVRKVKESRKLLFVNELQQLTEELRQMQRSAAQQE